MEAEQRLIEYTIQYECQLLEQEILDVNLWGGFDLPELKDLGLSWFPTVAGKLFQILIYPFMILLAFVTILILNGNGVFEQWQIKRKLKNELRYLKKLSAPYQSPDTKNIEELWQYYGLDKRHGREQQLHLIEKWVELLYDHEVLKRLNPKALLAEIRSEHALANKAYCKGDKDAPYFFFSQDDISLTREITKMLPAYDEVCM
jgi:hypothetical protein